MECLHSHPNKECTFYAVVGDLESVKINRDDLTESEYERAHIHLDISSVS